MHVVCVFTLFPDRITVVFFSKRISDIVYTCLLRHLPRDRRTVLNMLGDMHGHACLHFPPRIALFFSQKVSDMAYACLVMHFLPQDRPDFPPEI